MFPTNNISLSTPPLLIGKTRENPKAINIFDIYYIKLIPGAAQLSHHVCLSSLKVSKPLFPTSLILLSPLSITCQLLKRSPEYASPIPQANTQIKTTDRHKMLNSALGFDLIKLRNIEAKGQSDHFPQMLPNLLSVSSPYNYFSDFRQLCFHF